MAKLTSYCRQVLIAAAFFAVAGMHFEAQVCAQEYGNRGDNGQGDRGQRRGREGRRGGPGNGPGGDRQRDREGGRNRENGNNDRPAEPRPATPTPAPAAASTANSFGTVSESERIRKFATDTLKKHDANGNGILEGDELKDLGTSKNADKDGDGKITHNELVAFYTPKTAAPTASASPAIAQPKADAKPTSTADSDAKRLIVNKSRKSYRFKSTKERSDNWKFSSKDANGDGQVSMNEFSSSWSDRTATEFLRYDKDNDGMITVEEAK